MPELKPIKLVMVTAENNNKYYSMTPQGTQFVAEWGRVGVTKSVKTYGISKWDSTYKEKIKKGYTDVSDLVTENVTVTTHKKISEPKIDLLMSTLLGFSKKSVADNYTVSSDAVTTLQVADAQGRLDELTNLAGKFDQKYDVQKANNLLLNLYTTIPRRMANVKHHLLDLVEDKPLDRFRRIIDTEQKTLDVMSGQVKMRGVTGSPNIPDQTILDVLGISVGLGDALDEQLVKKLMGPEAREFRAVYKVIHNDSKKKFDGYVEAAQNKQSELFWHGSRNENWIGILQSSLIIRPSNTVLNGSMWGDGIYAANKYRKSANYTSLAGSYWIKGNQKTAFLGLFDFHVGNQLHLYRHDHTAYDLSTAELKRRGNYDSVYAHGGYDLVNDEFIIYNSDQTTIRYLVEVGK
jgi:poly [ADP-ribose] polymerase